MELRTCTLDDCNKPNHARNLCLSHYYKLRYEMRKQGIYWRNPDYYPKGQRRPECENCPGDIVSNGYCGRHYMQNYRIQNPPKPRNCKQCNKVITRPRKGMCHPCYAREWRKTQPPKPANKTDKQPKLQQTKQRPDDLWEFVKKELGIE